MQVHDAVKLARELMQQHGLRHVPLRLDNSKRRFGAVTYHPGTSRGPDAVKFVTLSRPLVLLNTEAQVKDTILHEIAHALTVGHGHDPVWQAKAREIGANPNRCYDSNTVSKPAAKYKLRCNRCDYSIDRNRRNRRFMRGIAVHQNCGGHLYYQVNRDVKAKHVGGHVIYVANDQEE